MTNKDRDVSEDEVGAYSFNLRRTAAVEQSLGRIRHSLASDWLKLQDDEIQSLAWVLGEAWAHMGFYAWDQLKLADINMDVTDILIDLGRRGRAGRLSPSTAADKAVKVLSGL